MITRNQAEHIAAQLVGAPADDPVNGWALQEFDAGWLIQEHARVAEILSVCLEEGMRTLKMDGIEKVLQGITDMAQVRAVCIK